MKGNTIVMLTLAAALLSTSAALVAQDELQSLRGSNPVEKTSLDPDSSQVVRAKEPLPRTFEQQPPLIPHVSENYQIDLKANRCLTCHGIENYERSGATRISPSHYMNRQGQQMSNLSASRYFCTQCHVSQTAATPLVENEFEPAKASG